MLGKLLVRRVSTSVTMGFELTGQAWQAIDNYKRLACWQPGQFLYRTK